MLNDKSTLTPSIPVEDSCFEPVYMFTTNRELINAYAHVQIIYRCQYNCFIDSMLGCNNLKVYSRLLMNDESGSQCA